MNKATYNEIIRQLSLEKTRLLAELEHLEKTINSLTILKNGVNIDKLTNENITNSTDKNSQRKNYYENVDVDIPKAYNRELTTIQLFFYVLDELGEGTVDELVKYVLEIDSSLDQPHVFSRFRDIASGLFRAGKIYADTTKKKYKYSLKEIKSKDVPFEVRVGKEIDNLLNL
ncbi:hypothetical protein SAMN05192574_105133 [Mucilaginibacter gossypiicola]|uniref:Uncharacterized protein n=1 Tax=Mucilaginibacter gossypiicola TaxID=551995 RepID=A0A1H8LL85_9SPHI|nr:hypothetical protein [Mucilaginibacter gossypiicola]SEO05538.1 hypothetical protein SAMN05192574_105133 [Mucilaginibacter gossypiicola]